MTTFPSSSTPTRTGEVCSPPPDLRVMSIARWLLATNARASSELIDSELVVVEDGPPLLAPVLPADRRVRLVSSGQTRSIGEMRNQACSLARGDLIVEWDDDDWHAPQRVGVQVEPLRRGTADMTGLNDLIWFEVEADRCWR